MLSLRDLAQESCWQPDWKLVRLRRQCHIELKCFILLLYSAFRLQVVMLCDVPKFYPAPIYTQCVTPEGNSLYASLVHHYQFHSSPLELSCCQLQRPKGSNARDSPSQLLSPPLVKCLFRRLAACPAPFPDQAPRPTLYDLLHCPLIPH